MCAYVNIVHGFVKNDILTIILGQFINNPLHKKQFDLFLIKEFLFPLIYVYIHIIF
jgi:hypothetical protein